LSALHDSNLARAVHFLRQYYARVLGISLLVLVPCFWQTHIGFGDFPSHLYNAWLYPKVAAGELQGLTVSGQRTNILSDVVLTWLLQHTSAHAAERIVLAGAALLMFWGIFAVVTAVSGRITWWLAPFPAMLTYGWAFQLGFLNSYLATAFCLLIFALLWSRPAMVDFLFAAPLLLLAALAHPAALAWLVGTLAFGWIVRASAPGRRWLWPSGGIVALVAMNRFAIFKLSGNWYPIPWLNVIGADQFYIFRVRFYWLAVGVAVFWLFSLVRSGKQAGWKEFLSSPAVLIYLLNCAAVFLSPISLAPPGAHAQRFGFLADRLSLMAAVLACSCIATIQPKRWMRAATWLFAAIFFWFLFTDVRQLNRVEARVDELLRTIPQGQRVAALIYYPRARDSYQHHMINRECIGRCWSYSDYEPSSGHFRIIPTGSSAFVLTAPKDVDDVLHGRYIARKEDLPLYQIYPCGPREMDLCIRALHEGERNGAIDLLRHW